MAKDGWTRRRFVGTAAACGVLAGAEASALPHHAQEALPPPASQKNSPEITAGGLVPLLESNIARPMRYGVRPGTGLGTELATRQGAFTIRNGGEFFNRPLYGPNIPFRVDGGDLPEFSLYLPGHGGNLRLGFATAEGEGKWLHESGEVISRYDCGRLLYEVRDPLLGKGVVRLQALVDGVALRVEASGEALPAGMQLTLGFAGVSGRKGKRNGDIGCEVEPVSRFFQVRPEECKGNRWALQDRGHAAEVASGAMRLRVAVPDDAELRVVDGTKWNSGWGSLWVRLRASSRRWFGERHSAGPRLWRADGRAGGDAGTLGALALAQSNDAILPLAAYLCTSVLSVVQRIADRVLAVLPRSAGTGCEQHCGRRQAEPRCEAIRDRQPEGTGADA